MDIFITVVSWIIGLYVAFILLLAIGFAAGGAANTGSSELSIISIASSLLLIYLIWMGVSSLFFSDEADAPDINSSISAGKVKEVYYDTTEIDVSGFMNGIYFVRLVDKGQIYTGKIIVAKEGY